MQTFWFRCYLKEWERNGQKDDLDCSIRFQRPEEDLEDSTDDWDNSTLSDYNSTDWDNSTDWENGTIAETCPLRYECKFRIPYNTCSEFTIDSCYNDANLTWIGNMTLFACYQVCVPSAEDLDQIQFG